MGWPRPSPGWPATCLITNDDETVLNKSQTSLSHTNKKARRSFRTLPEGEEDDRLDHEELEHGAVRAEQLPGGEVKEEEGVEGQANGDVVDDGHVQVTAGNAVEREGRQKDVRGVI